MNDNNNFFYNLLIHLFTKLQYVECVEYDGVIVGQKMKKIQRNNTGGPSREISTESKPASLDDDYCFLKTNPVVIQYPVLF